MGNLCSQPPTLAPGELAHCIQHRMSKRGYIKLSNECNPVIDGSMNRMGGCYIKSSKSGAGVLTDMQKLTKLISTKQRVEQWLPELRERGRHEKVEHGWLISVDPHLDRRHDFIVLLINGVLTMSYMYIVHSSNHILSVPSLSLLPLSPFQEAGL